MKNKSVLAAFIIIMTFSLFSFKKKTFTNTLQINVEAVFAGKKLVLEKEPCINAKGDTVYIDLFRFYLSNISLKYENGDVYKEKNSYHLLDVESGSMNFSLQGVPSGKIVSIDFMIGVDSAASVSGALDGDLDPAKGMYWAWNSGYINAKLEGRSPKCTSANNGFEFHVGGYLPKENAARRVSLKPLAPKNVGDDSVLKITADAAVWMEGIKLSQTHHIMMPGAEAMKMADRYKNMFKLIE